MTERDSWIEDCAWRLCLHILPDVLGRECMEPDGYLMEDYGMDICDAAEIAHRVSELYEGVTLDDGALAFFMPQASGKIVFSVRDLAEATSDALAEDAAQFIRDWDARRAARLASVAAKQT